MKKFIGLFVLVAVLLSAYSCAPNVNHQGTGTYVNTSYAYSYAPDGVMGSTFYCAGQYDIKDHIVVSWHGREKVVLEPGPLGSWDDAHVCDPSVVNGDFNLNGVDYDWVMAYTGTQDPYRNGTMNSVGLAFSNDRLNWVKRAEPFHKNRNDNTWGVGQPWITSVVGGEVLIGYTGAGSNGHLIRHVDLSQTTDSGGIEVINRWSPSGLGLNPVAHLPFANADFAYEPVRDRFWVVRASYFSRTIVPEFIAEQLEVAWIDGGDFWAGTGSWTSIGGIDIETSGKLKNHNGGFVTNQYGHLTSTNIKVLFTVSHTQAWPQALWEYRIRYVNLFI